MYVCDLQQLCHLVIQHLLVLSTDTGRRDARVALGSAQERDPVLDADGEIRLGKVSLHLSGLEEPTAVGVEATEEIGVGRIRRRQSPEEGDYVRRLDSDDTIGPVLVDIPLVQVEVEDFVVRFVDHIVRLESLRRSERWPSIQHLRFGTRLGIQPGQNFVNQVIAPLALLELLESRVVGGLAFVEPRKSFVAPVLFAGHEQAQLDRPSIVFEVQILLDGCPEIDRR